MSVETNQKPILLNTYKLLAENKKLTVGYVGGSITYGRSAMSDMDGQKGNINLSYVNRTSNWLKQVFPDAEIETVNAGVSDTATNFGIYRLEKTLMNENGHDMPDLVFIEFTSNDWEYDTQGKPELIIQVESIIHNIWTINPYAEIVFLSTSRYAPSISIAAYKEVGLKYNIPFIDVGTPIKEAILKRTGEEIENKEKETLYYTVDNLHPSHIGYALYFDHIKETLETCLDVGSATKEFYNYKENNASKKCENLIDNPKIITAEKIEFSGNAQYLNRKVFVWQHGTGVDLVKSTITENCEDITGVATAKTNFYGSAFGILFDIKSGKKPIILRYKIDDGGWKDFRIDLTTRQHQMYEHPQAFMFAHTLSKTEHRVEIEFLKGSDVYLAGLLVNQK